MIYRGWESLVLEVEEGSSSTRTRDAASCMGTRGARDRANRVGRGGDGLLMEGGSTLGW